MKNATCAEGALVGLAHASITRDLRLECGSMRLKAEEGKLPGITLGTPVAHMAQAIVRHRPRIALQLPDLSFAQGLELLAVGACPFGRQQHLAGRLPKGCP